MSLERRMARAAARRRPSLRRVAVGLGSAGLVAAGLGQVSGASAEQRTIEVTLAGGRVVSITVDVPPGTPLDQIPLPDLGVAAVKVTGGGGAGAGAGAGAASSAAPGSDGPDAGGAGTAGAAAAVSGGRGGAAAGAAGRAGSEARRQARAVAQAADDARARAEERADGTRVSRAQRRAAAERRAAGAVAEPDPLDPGTVESIPGPAPVGVPNFFIDRFRIPPFLLPIYQAAGVQYGVRWEVLAAINEIETDYGRNLNVSSAGALGWMQFMPATWKAYGVDANGDGEKDPYNPVDAIFAAARYLRAAGAEKDLRKAIFAYNHADWYVDSVLLRARLVGGLPPDLVGSLTGLTQGVFPVAAKARYAGADADAVTKLKKVKRTKNAAKTVDAEKGRDSLEIFSRNGAAAIAVQDGEVVKVGYSSRLGRFVQLRDAFGNTYTYGNLKRVSVFYPVPKPAAVQRAEQRAAAAEPAKDPKPTEAASAGTQRQSAAAAAGAPGTGSASDAAGGSRVVPGEDPAGVAGAGAKQRVFANPLRPAARQHGGAEQVANDRLATGGSSSYLSALHGLTARDVTLKRLKKGSRVLAGTVLGRLGDTPQNTNRRGVATSSPFLRFEVRPVGKGAPRIDPKPVLDGWKLLESTAVYRAKGSNAFFGENASAGQVLLMSKEQLVQRVLANKDLDIYGAGRQDIERGVIDRRVLALLEYLTANGLRLQITSLKSGHSILSKSGNVSEHSTGTAVDIAAVNGIRIERKTQGAGSITDQTNRLILQLQGAMKPHQIISLMTYPGTDNTLSLPDHDDHIHVGYRPQITGSTKLGKQVEQVLKPGQWIKLIDRISEIDNPTVLTSPSKYAIKTRKASKDD
ncbi:lytic murein transglycosylase [Patulibacter brassicae]|uniref:Lytic murein transglycosylase n=1 Tax=Patulibacter brassicae TaxID=1705717 RepID=A0ABU4VPR8_9ACTN|nr:lytic murein transglycosylase [Patulibacter brassicae]MDX8153852.1 lytic murein transglycosylase [Patulibacter brassicae]